MVWAFIVWSCLSTAVPKCTVTKTYWPTLQECKKAEKQYLQRREHRLAPIDYVIYCQQQTTQ